MDYFAGLGDTFVKFGSEVSIQGFSTSANQAVNAFMAAMFEAPQALQFASADHGLKTAMHAGAQMANAGIERG